MVAASLFDLLHGRPDVVEELDLGYRPQASSGLADGAADDVGFGHRRVVAAVLAEPALEPEGGAEHTAFALQFAEEAPRARRPRPRRTP